MVAIPGKHYLSQKVNAQYSIYEIFRVQIFALLKVRNTFHLDEARWEKFRRKGNQKKILRKLKPLFLDSQKQFVVFRTFCVTFQELLQYFI